MSLPGLFLMHIRSLLYLDLKRYRFGHRLIIFCPGSFHTAFDLIGAFSELLLYGNRACRGIDLEILLILFLGYAYKTVSNPALLICDSQDFSSGNSPGLFSQFFVFDLGSLSFSSKSVV